MAAIGVVDGALRPLPVPVPRRAREDGVGVRAGFASDAAKREWCGGVTNAEGVEDPRRLRRLGASPGDENVFPMGLEYRSSGDDGPVKIKANCTPNEVK